jgi:hypothetical protein
MAFRRATRPHPAPLALWRILASLPAPACPSRSTGRKADNEALGLPVVVQLSAELAGNDAVRVLGPAYKAWLLGLAGVIGPGIWLKLCLKEKH